MLITMPTRRTMAVLISLIGLGTITHVVQSDRTPLYGIDSDSDSVREPSLLSGADDDRHGAIAVLVPEDGYRPHGDAAPPPAELLALGTWPLDPDQPKQGGEMLANGQIASESSAGTEEVTAAQGGQAQTPASPAAIAAAETGSSNRAANESVHGEQLASGQAASSNQVGVISVAPVTMAAAPEVLETHSGARNSANTDGMMDALIAAFDASHGPSKTAKEPASESRAASAAGAQKNADASAPAKVSRDRAHEFLESIGLAELPSIDKVGAAVTEGVKQVATKARDLLGEFVAFLGVSKEEKAGTAVATTAPKASEKKADLGEEIKPKERWVIAEEGQAAREVMGAERIVLSAASLDDMRGGFVTDTGLKVSFGIDRATYINGNLVTMTSLNVADLGALKGGGTGQGNVPVAVVQSQAGGGATAVGGMNIVQNGANNVVQTNSLSPNALGTIVQNSLDNQKIQNVTTVNTTVNSGQMLRSINFQYSLRDALTAAARKW